MHRVQILGVFLLQLACLITVVAQAQDDVDDQPNRILRSNWSPNRPGTLEEPENPPQRNRGNASAEKEVAAQPRLLPIEVESPKLHNTAKNETTEDAFLLPPDSVSGAVYLQGNGLPKLGPDANCNNLWCVSCRDQFGNPGDATASGVVWPTRLERFWARPEYLLWWTQGANVPTLVTAGLGGPVLFGGDDLNSDWRSGGRIHAGIWLTPTQVTGIEGNLFALAEERTTFQGTGTAAAPLARPFFNIQIPGEDARLIPAAGFTSGAISIQATTELQGGELLLRHMLGAPDRIPTAVLVGYRYMRLDEDLRIDEFQTDAPGPTTVSLFDSFDTTNTFHGVNVGFISEVRYNRWFAEFLLKVALGNTHSKVRIDGATTTTVAPALPVTAVGGFLAQSSNIGTFEQDDFAVIPELGATIGFNITERLKATVGYTFIYWSRVARAGDQIDRDLNLPLVPGPNTLRPQFAFAMTDFWAQGVNLGFEYAF